MLGYKSVKEERGEKKSFFPRLLPLAAPLRESLSFPLFLCSSCLKAFPSTSSDLSTFHWRMILESGDSLASSLIYWHKLSALYHFVYI